MKKTIKLPYKFYPATSVEIDSTLSIYGFDGNQMFEGSLTEMKNNQHSYISEIGEYVSKRIIECKCIRIVGATKWNTNGCQVHKK